MKIVVKAILVLMVMLPAVALQAQCPGCVVQDSLCPVATTGTDVVICGPATFTDTAGSAFEANLTFLFNTGFVIRQGDDLFAALGVQFPIPIPGGFPAPFDIAVFVERGTLNSVTGLPTGLSWETDSSANGNNYEPYNVNRGCLKFCGTLPCGQPGTFTAVLNFTTLSRQNLSGLPTLPIPGFALPDSSLNDYSLPVTFTIDPSTNLILNVATAGPTTVIDSGQSITLNGTAGFDSYSWSSGEIVESITVAPADTTTYVLTVTDGLGCTQTDSLQVQVLEPLDTVPPVDTTDTTGITTIGYNDARVRLYPNPTQGNFTIEIAPAMVVGGMIEVIDLTGKRVYLQPITALSNTITLDVPKGLYIARIISGTNNYTRKLLIH